MSTFLNFKSKGSAFFKHSNRSSIILPGHKGHQHHGGKTNPRPKVIKGQNSGVLSFPPCQITAKKLGNSSNWQFTANNPFGDWCGGSVYTWTIYRGAYGFYWSFTIGTSNYPDLWYAYNNYPTGNNNVLPVDFATDPAFSGIGYYWSNKYTVCVTATPADSLCLEYAPGVGPETCCVTIII